MKKQVQERNKRKEKVLHLLIGQVTAKYLAIELCLTYTAISNYLDEMMADGLVIRKKIKYTYHYARAGHEFSGSAGKRVTKRKPKVEKPTEYKLNPMLTNSWV